MLLPDKMIIIFNRTTFYKAKCTGHDLLSGAQIRNVHARMRVGCNTLKNFKYRLKSLNNQMPAELQNLGLSSVNVHAKQLSICVKKISTR